MEFEYVKDISTTVWSLSRLTSLRALPRQRGVLPPPPFFWYVEIWGMSAISAVRNFGLHLTNLNVS